jgi:hypothetical protein
MLTCFVDADHAGCHLTHQLHTDVIRYFNQAPHRRREVPNLEFFRINLAIQIGDPRFWFPMSSGVASQIGYASKLVFYSLLFLQIEKNDYP